MPVRKELFNLDKVRDLLQAPGNSTISLTIIHKKKTTTQEEKTNDNKRIMREFRLMISRNKLPNDKSLSRILNALGYLRGITEARRLFELFDKQGKAGPWSYSAMMGLCHRNRDIAYALQIAQAYHHKSYPLDTYVTAQMMMAHRKAGKYVEAIALYNQLHTEKDTHLRNEYLLALLEVQPRDALTFWTDLVRQQKTGNPMLDLTSWNIIISYWIEQKEWNKAVDVFIEATKLGFYKHNQLDPQRRSSAVVLDFHFKPTYLPTDDLVPSTKKTNRLPRGGIPAQVAQAALLYFVKTSGETLNFRNADIITGGHKHGQDILKHTIPDFLKQQFDVDAIWDRSGLCQFSIPYAQLRRSSFIYCLWQLLDTCPDSLKELEGVLATSNTDDLTRIYMLVSRYRADLRRSNEGKITKVFSMRPQVPESFSFKHAALAKKGLKAFDKKNMSQAQQVFLQLTQQLPNHPWAYLRLGWVLHRFKKYNAAVLQYQTAINLSAKKNNWHMYCAEGYSYLGWSYDRQYHETRNTQLLEQALVYYQNAEQFGASSRQTDYLNRWGIALKAKAQLEINTEGQRHYLQQAIKKFQQAITTIPRHYEAHVQRGDCLLALGQYDDAIVAYQIAFDIKKREWPKTRMANAYLLQFRHTSNRELLVKAGDAANMAIRLHPQSDRAHLILSRIQAAQGKWHDSETSARTAKQINPTVKTAWLAPSHGQLGQSTRARHGQLSPAAREAMRQNQNQRTSNCLSTHSAPTTQPTPTHSENTPYTTGALG